MGSPTSQLDTLEFILSRNEPIAKLTPERWVELLSETLRNIGGQFEYLKAFGLNGLYISAFSRSGGVELDKQASYELFDLTQQWNGRHFVLNRNKTWGWFTINADVKPHVLGEYALGLQTHELLSFLRADAEWPNDGTLGYQLYAGIMQIVEKGIERMYERLDALEENLKHVRQQGMRVRALYETPPSVKDSRTS